MATDLQLNGIVVNEVESDSKLAEISQQETLGSNQIFFTRDGVGDDNAVGLPIGAIFASAIPIVDARVHLLDGSTISQSGIYEEFAMLVKSLVASGQPISCTQAEFNEDVSKTGNCGKFVVDDTAGTIRLPKITTFIQGLTNITNIGTSIEAGLPDITHTHPQYITANSGTYMGRQDYSVDKSSSDIYPHVDTGVNSTVSSIYGKSDTVQPNATQFPYYIVLASGYKSKKSLDVDNIMNEVNKNAGEIRGVDEKVNTKTSLAEVYPVGSIYLTINPHGSPASIFGGTWELIPEGYSLWTASSGAGETISAGLPNITASASFTTNGQNGFISSTSGAFTSSSSVGYTVGTSGAATSSRNRTLSLNASRSSSIYGSSTTVQPPAYKIYAYKRIS